LSKQFSGRELIVFSTNGARTMDVHVEKNKITPLLLSDENIKWISHK
jgi:hypothetical protein